MKKKSIEFDKLSKHHRLPVSRGGKNTSENISIVSAVAHRAWHTLFGNMTPTEIAKEINANWIDPAYEVCAIRKGGVT
ncbi:MAG: hypothetical protein ABIQ91_03925 [Candidatus Paceibacterota bacterium]